MEVVEVEVEVEVRVEVEVEVEVGMGGWVARFSRHTSLSTQYLL